MTIYVVDVTQWYYEGNTQKLLNNFSKFYILDTPE